MAYSTDRRRPWNKCVKPLWVCAFLLRHLSHCRQRFCVYFNEWNSCSFRLSKSTFRIVQVLPIGLRGAISCIYHLRAIINLSRPVYATVAGNVKLSPHSPFARLPRFPCPQIVPCGKKAFSRLRYYRDHGCRQMRKQQNGGTGRQNISHIQAYHRLLSLMPSAYGRKWIWQSIIRSTLCRSECLVLNYTDNSIVSQIIVKTCYGAPHRSTGAP